VLDDLDVPPQEESIVKKSIFKRAKENIISRFGDSDKGLIFGRRTSRDLGSGHEIMITSAESVTNMVPPTQPPNSSTVSLLAKPSPVNIKFTTLEELSSRGTMLKISGRNQFYRHVGTKLDVRWAYFLINSNLLLKARMKYGSRLKKKIQKSRSKYWRIFDFFFSREPVFNFWELY